MEVIAKSKYIRQSPRKLRLVTGALKGKEVQESLNILKNMPKRGTCAVEKTIGSALKNAMLKSPAEEWKIKSISVDGGPVLKRFRSATMGRAVMVKKRTSHITVVLEELERRKKQNGTKG
jgi:large subunit ribosomal protein L22